MSNHATYPWSKRASPFAPPGATVVSNKENAPGSDQATTNDSALCEQQDPAFNALCNNRMPWKRRHPLQTLSVEPVTRSQRDIRSRLTREVSSSSLIASRRPSEKRIDDRRIVSEPIPFTRPSGSLAAILAAEKNCISGKVKEGAQPAVSSSSPQISAFVPRPRWLSNKKMDPCAEVEEHHRSGRLSAGGTAPVPLQGHRPFRDKSTVSPEKENKAIFESPAKAWSPYGLSDGTSQPVATDFSLLAPQMHKLKHGTLTVMPSHSVLIDFREGERTRGRKGQEVLVVAADGSQVDVYSAPHLSSPCCLLEPTASHRMEALPPTYWKQMNDAMRVIEQIQSKTPKLIYYTAEAKCMMMLNGPQSNIELHFPSQPIVAQTKHSRSVHKHAPAEPSMRIRLFQHRCALELSRCTSSHSSREWSKKVYPFESKASWPCASLEQFDDVEKAGIRCLLDFLRISEGAQLWNGTDCASSPPLDETAASPTVTPSSRKRNSTESTTAAPSNAASTRNSAHSTKLNTPAGRRSVSFATAPQKPPVADVVPSDGSSQASQVSNASTRSVRDGFVSSATGHSLAAQTRFIPNIGWCMRHGSRVREGGRYKLMFVDGIALEVDVDEEWVEVRESNGRVARHPMGRGGRRVADRMKVFEQFVSLFDESSDE